jgi:hypothetical protein
MKTLTIYDIKYLSENSAPYFFTRKTLKFFGQTLKSFRVYKIKETGKYLIQVNMYDKFTGKNVGLTQRLFNPVTNELEHI